MFSAPKMPKPPKPAQMQAMQAPKDLVQGRDDSRLKLRRRGIFASIFTSPQGVSGPPTVTGIGASKTGG